MPTNDFKPFAAAGGANVKSQAQYLAAAERTAGMATGIADSALFNKVWRQAAFIAAALAEVMKDVTAADVLDDGDFAGKVAQLKAALNASGGGRYAVTGLRGKNNAGTPNTMFDLSAVLAQVRNPTSGAISAIDASAGYTCDVGLSGPAANGRDRSAVFSASSFVHFYIISGSSGVASISSAASPSDGGPAALPAGYDSWAYAGAVRFDGSSHLVKTYFAGSTAYYGVAQNVLNIGLVAVGETVLDLSGQVPANALAALLALEATIVSPGAGHTGSSTLTLRIATGLDYFVHSSSADNSNEINTAQVAFPLVGQQLIYQQAATNSGVIAFSQLINVNGYRLPNGGE